MSTKNFALVTFLITSLSTLLLVSSSSEAAPRGFRGMNVIVAPDASAARAAVSQRQIAPVSREDAQAVIQGIISAWNGGDLSSLLGDQFFDRTRLADNLEANVPRDAVLTLLALQDVQTLTQRIEPNTEHGEILVSQIIAIARTQIEYSNETSGEFVRVEGENEFLLIIKQTLDDAGGE